MQRLVLDTNAWLDWLVFYDPAMEPLRRAHAAGQVQIFLDAACEAELVRVLGYDRGRRSLDVKAQAAALERCHAIARLPDPAAAHSAMQLPKCRDADDQKFLELAMAAGADALVTKDKALLELSRKQLPFRIFKPEQLWPALAS